MFCGSQSVELDILLCPILYLDYNESMLALNSQYSKEKCKGTPDWVVNPPVIRFSFSITKEAISICSSKLTVGDKYVVYIKTADFYSFSFLSYACSKVIEEVGTGVFTDISRVQFINISGTVQSQDLNTGIINYQQHLTYMFSCQYPLQYLMDNTEIQV